MSPRISWPAWISRRCGNQPLGKYLLWLLFTLSLFNTGVAQEYKHSNKPPLHGSHWVAITGKPLAASAGALTFAKGGNAVDAACAMLAAAATMWDTLGWGGETQALIHNPNTGKVIAINALGAAPSGATPDYFQRTLGMPYPPEYGPLAAVTPGTPGGLLVMLAEFGTLSLAEVLAPAMEMAAGYPIEEVQVESIEGYKPLLRLWEHSRKVFLPNYDPANPAAHAAPQPGEMFVQADLLAMLTKLVETERAALEAGKNRKAAIMAAYDRFYRGDIAQELTRAVQEAGGLITMADLDAWQVHVEEPKMTSWKDIDVYKLDTWVQGPVLLQTLNLLDGANLRGMGYNSPAYIHTLYQAMNLAYADRDFYYGDPYYPPEEPIDGLLSMDYARQRAATINPARNNPLVKPGDPYPFQGDTNPFLDVLERWEPKIAGAKMAGAELNAGAIAGGNDSDEGATAADHDPDDRATAAGSHANVAAILAGAEPGALPNLMSHEEALRAGTTSIQAADAEGWMVSITPSGAWIPAFIAGNTGVGLSQRMQSFGMDPERNPFNVMAPGKRPRATLTPSIALKNGKPFLSFAVQGGDLQDQNLLQFFFNVVEFGMDVQEASEAANFGSYQVHSSFGDHTIEPGKLLLRADTSRDVIRQLEGMGYTIVLERLTSGPINGIFIDQEHGTLMGGSSNYGDDYGVAW